MSLPYLYFLPTDDDGWSAWSFNHAATHYTVHDAVTVQKGVNLDQFVLHPMNRDDLGMWLYNHQVMHSQTNAALGIQGYDLLSFDLEDPEQLNTWLGLNGAEHQNWNKILVV